MFGLRRNTDSNIRKGDTVKATEPCDGKRSVQYEIGRVIYTGRRALVEFAHNICGHDGHGLGRKRHCWMMDWDKLKKTEGCDGKE